MTSPTVKTRDISWEQLARAAEGEDYNKEDVVYEFSNGKTFKSTDNTSSGIYERQS